MNLSRLFRPVVVLAAVASAFAAQADTVGLVPVSGTIGCAADCVFDFGTPAQIDWSTTRSASFTSASGLVTSATDFKSGGATVTSTTLVANDTSGAYVSPVITDSDFSSLTVGTASYGGGFGPKVPVAEVDNSGYTSEARVVLAGNVAAGQSVTTQASTTVVGYFHTGAAAGQTLGQTVSASATADYVVPTFSTSALIVDSRGVVASLPDGVSFAATVGFSISKVLADGSLQTLYTLAPAAVDLPVSGSFSYQAGDTLAFKVTSTLSVTADGGANGQSLNLDLSLSPGLLLDSAIAVAVPEPSTLALSMVGLLGAAVTARRRLKQ